MTREEIFGNWMMAIAEAAEVAGSRDLNVATPEELIRAWDLVMAAAGITRHELARKVADQAGLRVAALATAEPHAAKLLPGEAARRLNVLPVRCTDRDLTVATANPLGRDALREVSALGSRTVHVEIAPPLDLEVAVLKAYGPAATDGAEAPVEEVTPGGPHVLVVDDEAGARALFRSVLEEGGYRVSVAKHGAEALEILGRGERFDLITLDYFMSRMNGLRVLQHLRADQRFDDLPVIMVTGADDRGIEMSLFEAGADDFVVKPVDAPLFLLRIQAVLRRRQLT